MNEVTKVNLGRQAFTISVDAHKELRAYLDAIAKQVDDTDVQNEVELRMAELLAERGISGDKVILPPDISYLKGQLGDPKDFKEDDDSARSSGRPTTGKRLFRDPQNALIGGVAAGLATYFGVDVLLIRIVFVLGAFVWGGSILVYIVLWLLVPGARTSSERLQMAGKPVTLESLKEAVANTDMKGAAHRAGEVLSEPAARVRDVLNTTFRIAVKIIGIGLTLGGLAALMGLVFSGVYLLVHGTIVADNLFPVGLDEHLLIYAVAFVTAMAATFFILCGMAVYSRKWPIHGWLTGVLIGLTLIGLVTAGALAADIAPKVHDRYVADMHSVTRQLAPFNSVDVSGENVTINFQMADTYSVNLKYFGNPNVNTIKTEIKNGVLSIDTQDFDQHRPCSQLCIPDDTYNMVVTVNSPKEPQINIPNAPYNNFFPDPLYQ